ncbi:MAG: glycoside hydrolase family 78 protein [Opitutales bacterium]|nr:glycoside hydrolase family 78 protein [Opitutales bacterium]
MTVSRFQATDLRCEYLARPLGIDERSPRLGWTIESEGDGARQTAYRVRVATAPEFLAADGADLWDSGRTDSSQTRHIVYGGSPLQSRQYCYWNVEVWDSEGNSSVSDAEYWSMGLLDAGDWETDWIAADPAIFARDSKATPGDRTKPATPACFRKVFTVPSGVRRATLYASARGIFEFTLGGVGICDDLFAPEWTDYRKRIQYRTYDVTAWLREGPNVLSAMLGDGWWSGYVGWQETRGRYGFRTSLAAQLELELDSGERIVVASDDSWRCNTGPVLASDFMMGETYDARRENKGADQHGYNDDGWLPAAVVDPPEAPLVAQRNEPVRITETIHPVSVKAVGKDKYLFDLGQNISGWVRIRVRAPSGTRLKLRHGERLDNDGNLYTENLRRAKARDVYICNGKSEEIWEPRFTFHGFQYFEIDGLPTEPTADTAIGCVVHSALPHAGCFECAHPGVNRLWLNGLWSQRDNFLTVPTDCPQRDERLGWTGDAEVFMRTASYNMDVAAFFTKWMTDIADAQTPEGIFPDTAPRLPEDEGNFVGLDGLGGGAGWADAGVIIPHTMWRVYGDTRIVERHWKSMTAWLDYLERTNPRGIRENELGNNYGDWLCIPSDTSFRTHSPMKNLLATAFWADDAAKMAEMAHALGYREDAARFEAMFEVVRDAFQKEFYSGDGRLTVETQTAYLLALAMNLLPEDVRARAAEHLVENIRKLDWHLSTGFIGIRFLNPILTDYGYADVAYKLLLQDDYPSWLYPVKHGATTIWERWNGWTEEDGFFNPHMNSFNHYSLGSIGEWLFRHVGGIETDPDHPGFRQFVLKPWPDSRLGHAKTRYRSIHGEIRSEWRIEGGRLHWTVRIPPNTSARVFIPADPGTRPNADGHPLPGDLPREGRHIVIRAEPGTHTFESTWSGF